MEHNVFFHRARGYRDLVMLFAGEEKCAPSHSYGPHIREYYILHFCRRGKGVLENKDGVHRVSAGELFVIRPGEVTTYRADEREPWEYVWLAFHGEAAEAFAGERSVFAYPAEAFGRFLELVAHKEEAAEPYMAFVYELIYALFGSGAEKPETGDRLRDVRRYIRYNYMNELSVGELAARFGFDRSHLYRLFQKSYGIGVKEYLTRVRLEKAREFLSLGHSVQSTAYMVGYADEFNFSRAFKKHFGIPPSHVGRDAE